MSNLTWFQRLRLRRLAAFSDEHSRITFWLSGSRDVFAIARLLPFDEVARRSYREGFRDFLPSVDVVINAQGISQEKFGSLFWHQISSDSGPVAGVDINGAASGKNIVDLRLFPILSHIISSIHLREEPSVTIMERIRRIVSTQEFSEIFALKVTETLLHEFAHLLQLQRSRLEQTYQRNLDRFHKAIARYHELDKTASVLDRIRTVKMAKLGEGQLAATSYALGQGRGGVWADSPDKIVTDFFAIIRVRLERLKLNICGEGFAEFIVVLSRQKTVPQFFPVAEVRQFGFSAQAIVHDFESLVSMVLAQPRDPAYYDRLNRQGERTMLQIDQAFSKLTDSTYRIGPIMIAQIRNSGRSLDDISGMDVNQIIKEHERVAVRKGEQPLVAISSGVRAHCNFTQIAAELNRQRHRLRGFTP